VLQTSFSQDSNLYTYTYISHYHCFLSEASANSLSFDKMAPVLASTSTLPLSHPLMYELASLRTQLYQYQRTAHQTSIQLQGAKLELDLVKEGNAVLVDRYETLRAEVEVLRWVPCVWLCASEARQLLIRQDIASSPHRCPTFYGPERAVSGA
jgi:hypothetical protein